MLNPCRCIGCLGAISKRASRSVRGGWDLRNGRVVDDVNPHALGALCVLDIPLLLKRVVAQGTEQQRRAVVVAPEVDAAKRPQGDVARVLEQADFHVVRQVGGNGPAAHDGLCEREVVVGAGQGVGDVPRLRLRLPRLVGAVVVYRRVGVALAGEAAGLGYVAAHPVGVGRRVGGDEDVCPLADAQRHHLGVVGLHGHKVVGDDGHGVPVDGEALQRLAARVDEAQAVRLAARKLEACDAGVAVARRLVAGRQFGAVKVCLAVDHVGVGPDGAAVGLHRLLDQGVVVAVVPVREHDGAEIDVVPRRPRSVYNHWSDDAACILRRVVGVVPRRAVQLGLEGVRVAFARRNRALGDTGDAIFPGLAVLQEAVPVQGDALLGARDVVVQRDLDRVAPVGFYQGAGECAVDEQHRALVSVWRDDAAADGEVIRSYHASAWEVFVVVGGVVEQTPGRSVGQGIVL